MDLLKILIESPLFWSAWLVIPVAVEILPALAGLTVLLIRRIRNSFLPPLSRYPEITVVIPVYNSGDTLEECIRSVYESSYPRDKIFLMAVDNGSKDNSKEIFASCRERFKDMKMYLLESKQGKSRALNMAVYNASGLYTILIDSDGRLDKNALTAIVKRFESDVKINCITGSVLTDSEAIKQEKKGSSRLLQSLEFMEYARSFFIGRARDAEFNAVYTMSGAFSAFRTSVLKRSKLFDNDTLCEDTNMTFQMRLLQNEKIEVCEDALFTVAPIENAEKLYTQRQRWQIGSLEVAKQFRKSKSAVALKTLLLDHTFSFPRLMWSFVPIFMLLRYSPGSVLIPLCMIYAAYVVLEILYFISACASMRRYKEKQRFYLTLFPLTFIMPLYGIFVFVIRLMGIANSFSVKRAWTTRTFAEEKTAFMSVIKNDIEKLRGLSPQKLSNGMGPQEEKAKRPKDKTVRAVKATAVGLIYLSAFAVLTVTKWLNATFGIGIEELIRTLTGRLTGTGKDMIVTVVESCVIPILICLLVITVAVITVTEIRPSKKNKAVIKEIASLVTIFGITMLSGALIYAESSFGIVDYCLSRADTTTIYEEYYVAPDTVAITPSDEPKNLIHIYVESMETTYTSADDGGIQRTTYIPYLSKLASENVSFSDSDKLGGWHACTGTGWTIASLFATTTGVPFALSADGTYMNEGELFAPGITALGDILQANGYNQEFICGSDADFAGRRNYFTQHGNYEIFDLYTAREKNYIPNDYYVWWGYEDKYLFEIAKDEVLRLADADAPFNITMLTVDTHHVGGYICDLCDGSDRSVTGTVVSCTDRQVYEFVTWCQKQDFYKDTVIVITGDHPRMDKNLVGDVSIYERTVYNCFINTETVPQVSTKNREFTAVDIFPTLLSAMGFDIEGGKLGLGTDLFSGQKTLAEEKSVEWLDEEFGKRSDYYVNEFTDDTANDDMSFS